jgi:ribosomal protein S18 acetylase RimI-like enzyme
MHIEIAIYSGETLNTEIAVLAGFRLCYFREFPYLYVGTENGEQEHLAEYIANPTTRLLVARDRDADEKVVGIAVSTMLSTEAEILRQIGKQLHSHKMVPERCGYFGEMIFIPEYRNLGVGKRMLEMLKSAGRKQNADQFCFLSVSREPNDVRRPTDHIDSALIFRKFGFTKTDLFVTFEWPTIQPDGYVEKILNRLDLWINAEETVPENHEI